MSEMSVDAVESTDRVGQTSQEAAESKSDKKQSALLTLNVYDVMLLIGFVCIILSIILLYVELSWWPSRIEEYTLPPISR